MRVAVLTIGSRGDVQPFLALGQVLTAAGHSVTVCTCEEFAGDVRSRGLDYGYVNNDFIDFLNSDDAKAAVENSYNVLKMARTAARLIPKVGPMQKRMMDDLWEATRRSEPDLIVFHPKAVGAVDFAERLGVPIALGFFMPLLVETGDFPAFVFPDLPLGKWYRRATYRLLDRSNWWGTRKHINEWRRKQGMPARRGRPFLTTSVGEPIESLHAYSEAVSPRPADWPAAAHVTGYWFVEEAPDYEPPTELEAFLAAGKPPVYIGFGSMFGCDSVSLAGLVVEAVERAGVRAILAEGWGGLDCSRLDLPGSVLAIGGAPHEWLLPRVSAVVHHGGCGTTAAGLRAGRPTVVCPFFGDQPFWGARIAALGAGPPPIPQRRLTAENLGDAIRAAVEEPSFRQRAEEIGRSIQAEDGVSSAVRLLESIAPRS